MILVQIGSANEGRTDEEKAEYTAGLKQLLQGLREKNVNDFTTVAAEIAAYRSRYLQDPSRILTLNPSNGQ